MTVPRILRRVSVRWDDDPYLFPDPYQGWPAGPNGYTNLIDGRLADPRIRVRTETPVTLEGLDEHIRREQADVVVLRCPLDVFCGERFGRLDRYCPIETERNRALNDRYQNELRRTLGSESLFFAGRLANYLYIDMDDCMRQAIDASQEVLESVGVTA